MESLRRSCPYKNILFFAEFYRFLANYNYFLIFVIKSFAMTIIKITIFSLKFTQASIVRVLAPPGHFLRLIFFLQLFVLAFNTFFYFCASQFWTLVSFIHIEESFFEFFFSFFIVFFQFSHFFLFLLFSFLFFLLT